MLDEAGRIQLERRVRTTRFTNICRRILEEKDRGKLLELFDEIRFFDALAIGGKVILGSDRATQRQRYILAGPHARLFRHERVAFYRIAGHHNPIVHRIKEKQILTVSRKDGSCSAGARDLPVTALVRKRAYMDLGASRLVGTEGQPASTTMNASDFGVSQLRPRVVFVAIKPGLEKNFRWPEPRPDKPPTVGECLFGLMAANNWRGVQSWKKRAREIAPTIVGGSKKHGGPDLGPTRAKRAWLPLVLMLTSLLKSRHPTPLKYEQYSHLGDVKAAISVLAKTHPKLAASLGGDYTVSPDVVIIRHPEPDENINTDALLVDDSISRMTVLRDKNHLLSVLHASISCKWTLRSDRAQNARTQALNLMRHRKVHFPARSSGVICNLGEWHKF